MSMLLEAPSWWITFGVGTILMFATLRMATRPPLGVSSGRLSRLLMLWRVSGVLQTCTS